MQFLTGFCSLFGSFSSCPHGRCFTVLAQCFAISSWVTSLVAVTSCYYIYVRPIPEEGEPELPREGFGYISRQAGVLEPPSYRQCVFYSGDEKDDYFSGDGMWRAGKAMSLMACGIGGIVMCIIMCTCCVAFELPTFDALFWTCMFCFVAQALTFLSWGSDLCDDYECTWSSGTGMNITATMLWVWAANMIKSFPQALPPRKRGRRRPVYHDDDGDDSPYLNNNREGFGDEYEEGDWQNQDGEYYDDYGDDNYYGDDQGNYNDDGQYYDDEQGYDENQQYDDGSYPTENDSSQETKGKDEGFEPNAHFQETWEEDVDNVSAYDASSENNAFKEDPKQLRRSQHVLSEEELKFTGGDIADDQTQESFGALD